VFELAEYALLTTAVAVALLHTLIPDHWLPFVLIGRARDWSVIYTAKISIFSSLIHVVFSVAIGLLTLVISRTAAIVIGESLELASASLLVLFGIVYAVWAWRKGGHFHPGGCKVHLSDEQEGCAGDEGDAHPEHLHYHADDGLISGGSRRGAYWLAFIIGANPCILLLPILASAAPEGVRMLGLVILAYSVPMVVMMVGLSVLGVVATRRFRLPLAARHMEAASGVLIALLGILFVSLHLRGG
jgi:nickel/cobalt exporter